jgi:hypothetical protein
MNKIYKMILTIAFTSTFMGIIASENGAAQCPSTITIEAIYKLDEQGAFDGSELRSAAQLNCYKKVLEVDIQKNEEFLKTLQVRWTNKLWNAAQKIAGLGIISGGALGRFIFHWDYGFSRNEVDFYQKWMKKINQGDLKDGIFRPGPKPIFYVGSKEEVQKKLDDAQLKCDQAYFYYNIARITGSLAILAGTALFGYSIYHNRTVASEKAKALESIRCDKAIIEKIEKIENSIVL